MTETDAEALRALHDAHAAGLWHYVVRLTRDPQQAEDVVQETLLRAWRRSVTDGERPARPWLFTVARNLVIDDVRSARHRHELATDAVPDHGVGDRTDAVFDAMLITEALQGLSEDHRAVVVRAYYGRATVAELAADLDIPAGTVKSRLHYGLRALRLALQEKGVTR